MTAPAYDGNKYLYAFTREDGLALFGDFTFSRPRDGTFPDWMPQYLSSGTSAKRRGYYGLVREHLIDWTGPELWLIESRYGWKRDIDGDRMISRQARLVRRLAGWDGNAMLSFACDCAERQMAAFDQAYPHDPRPGGLLEALRAFASGNSDRTVLHTALGDAKEAEEAAALLAYRAREDKQADAPVLLDAARAARAVMAIGQGVLNAGDFDFHFFIVRPVDETERAWQLERKSAYINGMARK